MDSNGGSTGHTGREPRGKGDRDYLERWVIKGGSGRKHHWIQVLSKQEFTRCGETAMYSTNPIFHSWAHVACLAEMASVVFTSLYMLFVR